MEKKAPGPYTLQGPVYGPVQAKAPPERELHGLELNTYTFSPPVRVVRFYVSPIPRTSTTTILAQCSLPDLNRDHSRPLFPARPQPRPSAPSVPCRTPTASPRPKCSLPGLKHSAQPQSQTQYNTIIPPQTQTQPRNHTTTNTITNTQAQPQTQ